MALLSVLLASALLTGLGLSIALLGSAEMALARHDRETRALSYAARAAAAVAMSDLRALPSTADVGAGGPVPEVSATPGRFVDASLVTLAPWGDALDLRALTVRVQAESDAATPPGGFRPIWRLFVYGDLARLMPQALSTDSYYLVVWVADDRGVLLARSAALGPGDARAITEISIVRLPDPEMGEVLRPTAVRPGW